MKIAILGFGVEGHSAYNYWKSSENEITICDQNQNASTPVGVSTRLGSNYLSDLDGFDLIVRVPGLNPNDIVQANSPEILNKVTTSTNEFFRVSPTKNIIGVTGTKGKGTTCTLITKLLEASGKKVHLGGNIGRAAIDLLNDQIQPDDWVVLELSSFQLVDLKYSPHIAVCLMVVPEHLNWHSDMNEYIEAKRNIFAHQVVSDTAIYYADNEISKKLASSSQGNKIAYYSYSGAYVKDHNIIIDNRIVCQIDEVKLIGEHNLQNICAALTAYWQIDQNLSSARQVVLQFSGLEHRLELVRELNDVKYYNDSFASVPDATIAAVKAIKEPKILIIGGFDRQLNLNQLAVAIKENEASIKRIILIGDSAGRVSSTLQTVDFSKYEITNLKNMNELVKLASEITEPHDAIVLSPGFPSFDMFKNFEDRGQQFKQAVNNL